MACVLFDKQPTTLYAATVCLVLSHLAPVDLYEQVCRLAGKSATSLLNLR